MKYCSKCGSKVLTKQIDGVARFQCAKEECATIYWNNPTPVVAALVKFENRYIIARNAKWPAGVFSLITGYLEAGEQPEVAVVREVYEELGLRGKVVSYLGHYIFPEKNQLILAFEIEADGLFALGDELAEAKHLSAPELSNYNFKPLYITEAVINSWKQNQP